jgi:hypothetical protein
MSTRTKSPSKRQNQENPIKKLIQEAPSLKDAKEKKENKEIKETKETKDSIV